MNLFKKKKQDKVAVFSIDGMPYSFVERMTAQGKLPNLKALFDTGVCRRMNSVYPTISSVAWSTYMTGVNPGAHNIYGFIDREPNPFEVFIPTSRAMKTRTLWEYLSSEGKKVVVINVPVTYPPRTVNGVLVSGFLATKLEKAVHPRELSAKLKSWDYRIDVDAWLGRNDKEKFMSDLHTTLARRVEAGFKLIASEEWDYFHLHIMESDRICHFLWELWENGDPDWAGRFEEFFEEIDDYLGQFRERLPDGTHLIVLSDHGFCAVKKEVYMNKWLSDNKYLGFQNSAPESIKQISPNTKAYSLIPGRIYLNLKGREWAGTVEPGNHYNELCAELKANFITMTDPDTGENIVDKVFTSKEIYRGAYLHRAADLIVIPKDGFDFKGNLTADNLTYKGELVGMHTYDDAFLYIDGLQLSDRQPEIMDLLPTVFELMKAPVPAVVEGISLI